MLGVKAVITESFERIHRSNLIGMGVLPLQFPAGDSYESLGLDGTETYDIAGVKNSTMASPRRPCVSPPPIATVPQPNSTRSYASTPQARPTTTATGHPPVCAAQSHEINNHMIEIGK